MAYVSQLLRIPPGTLGEKVISVGPVPERPTAGALFSYEDDTWMMTLAGLTGRQPPADRAGMIAFAAEFAPPAMLAALHAADAGFRRGCWCSATRSAASTRSMGRECRWPHWRLLRCATAYFAEMPT